MTSNHPDEGDRVMRQAMTALESQLKASARLSETRLAPLVSSVVRLAEAQDDGFWVHWAADFHVRAGFAVPAALSTATARWEAPPKSTQRK
jgi:hypothetical protein